MAKTTVTTVPSFVIPANSLRQILLIKNYAPSTVVFLRHGAAVQLGNNANTGVPLTANGERSLSGSAATLPVSAVTASGTADLYYEEFFE